MTAPDLTYTTAPPNLDRLIYQILEARSAVASLAHLTPKDPAMTTATGSRYTIITTDHLPTFEAVADDLGVELWPVEFRTHEDHIASTDFREWITGVLAAPLVSAEAAAGGDL